MTKWLALGMLALIAWRGCALYADARRARRAADDELPADWAELDPRRVRLIRDSGKTWR